MADVQDGILKELKRQADEQSNLVTFVNGEYQDFLKKNGFKRNNTHKTEKNEAVA